ncbi:hypothetical protein ACJX0J_030972, partial [Zea mays]
FSYITKIHVLFSSLRIKFTIGNGPIYIAYPLGLDVLSNQGVYMMVKTSMVLMKSFQLSGVRANISNDGDHISTKVIRGNKRIAQFTMDNESKTREPISNHDHVDQLNFNIFYNIVAAIIEYASTAIFINLKYGFLWNGLEVDLLTLFFRKIPETSATEDRQKNRLSLAQCVYVVIEIDTHGAHKGCPQIGQMDQFIAILGLASNHITFMGTSVNLMGTKSMPLEHMLEKIYMIHIFHFVMQLKVQALNVIYEFAYEDGSMPKMFHMLNDN